MESPADGLYFVTVGDASGTGSAEAEGFCHSTPSDDGKFDSAAPLVWEGKHDDGVTRPG